MKQLLIKNLSKTYQDGTHALKKINIKISSGMFGLLGPNGAGKSTLMRTIATLQKADEGEIILDGLNILDKKFETRKILGYLPQEFGVYPDISAEELLNHIALLKGIANKTERREVVKLILEQTDLYEDRKKKLGTFSGGMKQRFGIAQALIGNPELIIVDEPTAGLDPEGRNRFYNLLSEISENRIVILSTHIVDDIRILCKQMAIIYQGKVLLSGNTNQVITKLKGKIWKKEIKKYELAEYDNQFDLILSRLYEGNVEIHVLNDKQPNSSFSEVHPDLEDIYFSVIKGKMTVNN